MTSVLVTFAVASTALFLVPPQRARGQARALELRSANVVELDYDVADIAGRTVLLWIEIADIAACPSRGDRVEYGFLVDADRDRSTGITGPGLGIGIDARISATCVDDRWSSSIGAVSVTGSSPSRLEIRTTVGRLPSTSFHWIAYAARGGRVVGIPVSAPDSGMVGHSSWAILERSKP